MASAASVTVIFGTLGFSPHKLLPTVRSHEKVDRLVFFHDHEPRSREAAKKVVDFCKERGLPVTVREVDAFDILECATQMRKELKNFQPRDVIFNLTGGTPVISSAATLVCILQGVRAVYIHEQTKEEIMLPLLTVQYDTILNDAQRRVLRFVIDRAKTGCTQAEIAKGLDLTPSTVSHHVKKLVGQQLLEVRENPKDSRTDLLFVRPSASLLLEDS